MVGLSIVLESHQKAYSSSTCAVSNNSFVNNKVINKTNMIINKPSTSSSNPFFSPSNLHSSYSSSTSFLPFLEHCFLCRQKLLPGKDIYMYKGDRGFCSVECRYRQIFMDEEDSLRRENYCSFAAIKPTSNSSSSSSATSPNSNSRRQRKITRNRAAA